MMTSAGSKITGGGGGDTFITVDPEPWIAVATSEDFDWEPWCGKADKVGNTYIHGWLRLADGWHDGFMKVDTFGAIVWATVLIEDDPTNVSYYQYFESYGFAFNKDGSRGYLVGYQEDNNNWYTGVICFNTSTGEVIWFKKYGHNTDTGYRGGYYQSVVVDRLENIYITGQMYDYNLNYDFGFVAKLSSVGDILWWKTISEPEFLGVSSMLGIDLDSSGFVLITGDVSPTAVPNDRAVIFKIGSDGVKSFGMTVHPIDRVHSYLTSVVVDHAGNYICAGEGPGAAAAGIIVTKLTSSGTVMWTKLVTYVPASITDAELDVDFDNNIYLKTNQYPNILVFKFTTDGLYQWAIAVECKSSDWGVDSFSLDNGNNIYVTGTDWWNHTIYKFPPAGVQSGTYSFNSFEAAYSVTRYDSTTDITVADTEVDTTVNLLFDLADITTDIVSFDGETLYRYGQTGWTSEKQILL